MPVPCGSSGSDVRERTQRLVKEHLRVGARTQARTATNLFRERFIALDIKSMTSGISVE